MGGACVGDSLCLFQDIAAGLQQVSDARARITQRTAIDFTDIAESQPLVLAWQA